MFTVGSSTMHHSDVLSERLAKTANGPEEA